MTTMTVLWQCAGDCRARISLTTVSLDLAEIIAKRIAECLADTAKALGWIRCPVAGCPGATVPICPSCAAAAGAARRALNSG